MANLPAPDPDLAAIIAAGTARCERTLYQGETLWIKRPEALSGRLRLIKGDPEKAFRAEQAFFENTHGRDLPIARLIASGQGYVVIADGGTPIKTMIRKNVAEDEVSKAFAAGARALATLHAAGLSHGRPNLKDILWKDDTATLIDFERAAPRRNTPDGHAWDVILFIFNIFTEFEPGTRQAELAKEAYLTAGNPDIWHRAEALLAKRRWFFLLSRLAAPFLKGRDFRAIKPTFAYFTKAQGVTGS